MRRARRHSAAIGLVLATAHERVPALFILLLSIRFDQFKGLLTQLNRRFLHDVADAPEADYVTRL